MVVMCGLLLLGGYLAHAGSSDDCNQVRHPELQVRGCSIYIKRGIGTPANLATAHVNRANAYARRRKFNRALQDYAAAMELDPANPLVPYNRGNAYFDIKDYKHAIADYARAITLDGKFTLAYYNRGLAHERLGDNAAAVNDYRHVLALNSTAKSARKRLERLLSW